MFDKELKLRISIDSENQKITLFNDGLKKVDRTIHDVTVTANRFGRTWVDIAKGVGAVEGVLYILSSASGRLSDMAKSGIAYNAAMEKAHQTLTIIEGSSQKAAKSLEWVEKFAIETPFTFDEMKDSFIKLRAYGIDPTNGSLATLGDTAAGMGKPIMQAVEMMADAVVGENERLKEFGIRANVTGDQVKYSWTAASGEAKNIVVANNSEIIQSTLLAIFNEKYGGAMKAQADSWDGLTSNMGAAWDKFAGKMTEPVFDGLKVQIKSVTESLGEMSAFLDDSEKVDILAERIVYYGVAVAGVVASVKIASGFRNVAAAASLNHARAMQLEAQYGREAAAAIMANNRTLQINAIKTKAATAATIAMSAAFKATPYGVVAFGLAEIIAPMITANEQIDYLADGFDKAALAAKRFTKENAAYEIKKLEAQLRDATRAQQELSVKKGNGGTLFNSWDEEDDSKLSDARKKVNALRDALIELRDIVNNPPKQDDQSGDGKGGLTSDFEKLYKEQDKSLSYWENYYDTIGDKQTAWAIKEAMIIDQNSELDKQELAKLVSAKKEAYLGLEKAKRELEDKERERSIANAEAEGELQLMRHKEEEERKKEQLRIDQEKAQQQLNSWRTYYQQIGDIENAWLFSEERSKAFDDAFNVGKSLGLDGEELSKFVSDFSAKIEEEFKQNDGFAKLHDTFESFSNLSHDWTAGLEGNAKALANVGNAFADIAKEQDAYQKLVDKGIATDEEKDQHLRNQIAGYGNLAGAMTSFFSEGSREAAAFQAVQSGLALVNAVSTVAASAATTPFPANLGAIAATAATLSTFLSQAGIAFGGGSSGSGPSSAQKEFEKAEAGVKEITDRLDAQIDLLKAISLGGSATFGEMEAKRITAAELIPEATKVIAGNYKAGLPSWLGDARNAIKFDMLEQLGVSGLEAKLAEYPEQFKRLNKEVKPALENLKGYISDFAEATISTYSELSGSVGSWRDTYDKISGTDFFYNQDLAAAKEKVGELMRSIGVETYDALFKSLGSINVDISQLEKAIVGSNGEIDYDQLYTETQRVNKALVDAGIGAKYSAEELLNMVDSLDMVGEAALNERTQVEERLGASFSKLSKQGDDATASISSITSAISSMASRFDQVSERTSSMITQIRPTKVAQPDIASSVDALRALAANNSMYDGKDFNSAGYGNIADAASATLSDIDKYRQQRTTAINAEVEAIKERDRIALENINKQISAAEEQRDVVNSIREYSARILSDYYAPAINNADYYGMSYRAALGAFNSASTSENASSLQNAAGSMIDYLKSTMTNRDEYAYRVASISAEIGSAGKVRYNIDDLYAKQDSIENSTEATAYFNKMMAELDNETVGWLEDINDISKEQAAMLGDEMATQSARLAEIKGLLDEIKNVNIDLSVISEENLKMLIKTYQSQLKLLDAQGVA